ncbi:alpha/beta-hydrolase [Hypoxylon rubiginosum]|uniref:Alpha/beta-hydrolase n=1 Tax=Hypoxylon rubiginosum TaxID=110542 RepID=A0ACB9ZB91_9PEZI|nr:alpha/beta-hydrolase [Hypoxylon rubiginosum]
MGRSLAFTQAALLALATWSTAAPLPVPVARLHRKTTSCGNSTDSITWGACPDSFPSNVTCGTYTVPLDWSDPGGSETIELGLVRVEASGGEGGRIGNLFMNPGGPGGPATSLVNSLVATPGRVDPRIFERFDVIGLDPRGVGLSTPVVCDPAAYNERVSYFPKTQEEYDELVAYNVALGESCRAKTGRLIDFVDTISAVKDHEAVRKALGGDDEKVSLLGLSYGTQLFSQYAELFPDNIRALVLDGNLQHSQGESSNLVIESTTYEATLKQFFIWCANTTAAAEDACPLSGQDVQAVYESVLAKATASPIPAPGCDGTTCRTDVTEEDMRFIIQGSLISTTSWPALGQALADADAGDATLLSQQQPLATGDAYSDSSLFAGTAIACQDWTHASTSLSDVLDKATLGANFSPLTGGACQSYKIQTSCIGWPAPLSNPPEPVRYTGATTILQAQSTFDPSTSYVWGLGLHAELGDDRSVLLTRDGSGHTSYLRGGETAAALNAYLLDLTLPEPGTVFDS